jgi:selenocysteine-specific elongation factor
VAGSDSIGPTHVTSHIVVGTAGHIDHGKSALVLALTGTDPDRLKEERARGITIDLGFAYLRDGDRTIAFVDVPGHERFVRNMLAGVGGIDAVLLIVAADESVMPQTREHFDICRLLHVPRGLVVMTKCDLADADTRAMVRADVAELVQGSFLERPPIVEVSARTGEGLEALKAHLRTLVDQVPARGVDGAARLPIDRVFSMKGFGTVVTGTLVAGNISVDDELALVPGDRTTRVRGLQVHGTPATHATAGQRVALNLTGVDKSDLDRGQVLAAPGTLQVSQLADAFVELLSTVQPLRHGARVRLHQGTVEVLARVSVIARPADDDAPPEIAAGASGFVRLRLERPAALTRGDRFVLRAYSPAVTIGGGVILDPAAPRGGVRLEATLERSARLLMPLTRERWSSEPDAHALFVAEAGGRGLAAGDLIARAGVRPADVSRARQVLVEAGQAIDTGTHLVAPRWRESGTEHVLAALAAHHASQTLSEGLPREELRERVLAGLAPSLVDLILADLERTGRIVGRERVALAGREVVLSAEETRVRDALDRVLRDSALMPPDQDRLVTLTSSPAEMVDRVLRLMVRHKRVVVVGGLPFHQQALDTLKGEVAALKQTGAEAYVDIASFKSRYGLSRKFAIPLLEYLDRERVTRRVGERRLVL